MTATSVRPLADTPDDVALGKALVREYVVATAEETDQDVELILTLIPDVADFAGRFLRGGGFLVAEVDGAASGGVGITPSDDGDCEMNRLWIRPEFRRLGLGRILSETALAHARELGFTRMVLDVVPSRTGAIALYQSLGFVRISPFHDYPFEMVAFAKDLGGTPR
ncbi:MAG: GNAT family N-acetyltransferase [Actinomycetota bacterium]|nr:GNAT family N-acetyltransferase [Actinomycetota bacterium]